MQYSYWERDYFFGNFDVIIIGSGITGIQAANTLLEKQPNLKVAVLEKGPLPTGASTKNAGFACFGSISELLDDLSHTPEDEVWGLVERRWKGLLKLRKMTGDDAIDFNLYGGYELFREQEDEVFRNCVEKMEMVNDALKDIIGKNAFELRDEELRYLGFKDVSHLIFTRFEGQINTGKMMRFLCETTRARIFSGVTVNSWQEENNHVNINTSMGNIKCRFLIVTVNGFFQELTQRPEVKPARAQVLVTKPIKNLHLRGNFHYDMGYYYFRNIDGRILLGGGRNLDPEGETTTELKITEKIQNALDALLEEVILPDTKVEIDMRWSGIMGMGQSKKPLMTLLSPKTACAVGLGGMGVALGNLLGEEVANIALKEL